MKRILILGVSGSIGTQALDVILKHPEEYQIVGCSVHNNTAYLKELLDQYPIMNVGLKAKDEALEKAYPDVHFFYGNDGLCQMAAELAYDLVINALVGVSGILPTLSALVFGHDVALANKETLVFAGDIVNQLSEANHCRIIPVDSEHSAIFQCLNGEDPRNVRRLIITASGGAFRDLKLEDLKDVTLEQALHHPTWKMGKKVTIDSATMMNKGFEVIEAHYLFHVPYEQIAVLQHDESIIHSLVEYADLSMIAQMAMPDMRIPIQYALTYPKRIPNLNSEPLDLAKVGTLHFHNLDHERYPLLYLAYEVGKKGGNLGAVLNAADEEAINLFTRGKIGFADISTVIIDAVKQAKYIPDCPLQERFQADWDTRNYIKKKWQ